MVNFKVFRDPTDAELCDLAQSDSEHSRHWFFRGRLTPESGVGGDRSLMSQIKESIKHSNKNNLIAFSDNSRFDCDYHVAMCFRRIRTFEGERNIKRKRKRETYRDTEREEILKTFVIFY